ncbi:histamine H2 receptor-like [Oculina patagonica]
MKNTTQAIGEEGDYPHNNTDDEDYSASGEFSGEEDMFLEGFSAEFDTYPIILAIFIIVVNLTVIILFIRNRSLRTVTNSFLISLAASDLLAGLVGIPMVICCSAFGDNTFCPISLLIWRFISVSTVLHILLVSVDRYIAITHAMRYHNIVTRTVFFTLTILAWSAAAFVSLIQLSWRADAEMDEDEEEQVNKAQITYDLVVFAIFFAVPLFVMAFIYVRIFSTVRYHEKQIWRYHSPSDPEQSQNGKSDSRNSAQRKTATIFLAMLIIFIACWLPYFILSFQEQLSPEEFLPPVWVLYVFYYYARFFTSLANPLLYVLGKRDFREALLSALCKKDKARSESRASTTLTALFTVEQSTIGDSTKSSA